MKLVTAKGTELSFSWYGIAFTHELYIGIPNMSYADAISVFSDAEHTSTMTFYKDDNIINKDTVDVKRGYTRLTSLSFDEGKNEINIGLGKAYAELSNDGGE